MDPEEVRAALVALRLAGGELREGVVEPTARWYWAHVVVGPVVYRPCLRHSTPELARVVALEAWLRSDVWGQLE